MNAGTIVLLLFVVCYFAFGIKGATQFVDNRMNNLFQDPSKKWLRYVLIAIAAIIFAYIEFARLLLRAVGKILHFILGGWG